MEHYRHEDLDQPVYFNRPTNVADSAGGFTTSLVRNPTTGFHWAKVRPLRGTERTVADGMSATGELLFVMDSSLGIVETDVLVYGGVNYNVRYIAPPGYSQFVEITAEREVLNG
jgi:head-tail adaptor